MFWVAPLIAAAASAYSVNRQAQAAKSNAAKAYANEQASSEQQTIWGRENAAAQMAWEEGQMYQAQHLSNISADKMMDFQEESNAKQMAFQERMSSTAHQREVSDLRAAGLNPILSGTGGMGSSTPVGASSSGGMASAKAGHSSVAQAGKANATPAPAYDVLGSALSSALSLARGVTEIDKLRQDIKTSEATEELTRNQAVTEKEKPAQVAATTANILQDTEFKERMVGKTEAETAKIRMEVKRVVEEIYETYWRGLSAREDVFNKKSQGRALAVEANTMEGLQDKGLTEILKAHPLVSEFGDIIRSFIPRVSKHQKIK